MELVDQKSESVCLDSSAAGKRLYEKNGFEEIGEVELSEGYPCTIMLRKARN